jgi:hypothetical protein
MRRFMFEGKEFCEFKDAETKTLKITSALWKQLLDEYFNKDFVGVISALDGPNGTSWMYEINENGFFESITAITGYEFNPAYVIRARANVRLAG